MIHQLGHMGGVALVNVDARTAQLGLESLAGKMTEGTQDRSTWLIIAAVIIAASSLLCCGCLALAWIFGDAGIEIIELYSASPLWQLL